MSLLARYGLPAGAIEAESLARLRARLGPRVPQDPVAQRILYAAGDPDLLDAVDVHPALQAAATAALRRGVPLVCDGRMVAAGIARSPAARLGCPVLTAIDAPEVLQASGASTSTRAALAMRSLAERLDGAVAVIGTSPTALLALLDLVDAGRCRPAAVVATPVGLVAAAESKEELRARGRLLPYATVRGSRGGSPLAAAAVNALLALAGAAAEAGIAAGARGGAGARGAAAADTERTATRAVAAGATERTGARAVAAGATERTGTRAVAAGATERTGTRAVAAGATERTGARAAAAGATERTGSRAAAAGATERAGARGAAAADTERTGTRAVAAGATKRAGARAVAAATGGPGAKRAGGGETGSREVSAAEPAGGRVEDPV